MQQSSARKHQEAPTKNFIHPAYATAFQLKISPNCRARHGGASSWLFIRWLPIDAHGDGIKLAAIWEETLAYEMAAFSQAPSPIPDQTRGFLCNRVAHVGRILESLLLNKSSSSGRQSPILLTTIFPSESPKPLRQRGPGFGRMPASAR